MNEPGKNKAQVILIIIALCILAMVIQSVRAVGQQGCPNDVCDDAISVPDQTWEAFCNDDCNEDFDIAWDPDWWHPQFPCGYLNYDQWFQIEVQTGGQILFHIESNYTHEDSTIIGNFGPLEGVTMDIFSGDDCQNIEFIWGTACYWQTDQEYCCFPEYDPTRQTWEFSLFMEPGTYFVNVDGFGYSVGCGTWMWAEPFFLGFQQSEDGQPIPSSQDLEDENTQSKHFEDPVIRVTDLLGRQMKPEKGKILIYHFRSGKRKKIIIGG